MINEILNVRRINDDIADRFVVIPRRDMSDPSAIELAKHMRIVVVPNDWVQGPVSGIVITTYGRADEA